MGATTNWPKDIQQFIHTAKWTYAKTYAQTWPHEYLVRERVDEKLFLDMVRHIRQYGYKAAFYRTQYTYFQQDGMVYWTMGAPIEETIIINRCKEESTYESRLEKGTLPD